MRMPGTTDSSEIASGATAPAMSESFDLIVVGAGINGLGIARDAAARGLRVALVEREDIGSGTSNYSGRLIHGGLRYLEQGDLPLVRESLRERERLFRSAPHLVKPIPTMIPFYQHNRRSSWTLRAGMIAYDILSWDKSTASHFVLSRDKTLERFAGLDPMGLTGSAIYMDGQVVWSERLCLEVALAAHADGAKIYTYSAVDGLVYKDDAVCGVRFTDRITGQSHALGARVVVNAAGPWVDAVLAHDQKTNQRFIGGTKGSHLVVGPFPGAPSDVVYYESQTDGRLILVIPWGAHYLIGTTDLRFDGDPEDVRIDSTEVAYLLGEVNRLIPQARLKESDVQSTFSGVRPLPFAPDKAESSVSRSHVIHDHAPTQSGLLSIIGGKLTTYRSLAEETVDIIFRKLGKKPPRCLTASLPFPGARVSDWDHYRKGLTETSGLPQAVIDRLIDIYGSRASDIVAYGRDDPALLEPLEPVIGAIGAELVFTYVHEFGRTLTDVLIRRTMLGLNADSRGGLVERAADILSTSLGWDRARRDREVEDYRGYAKRYEVPGTAPSAGTAAQDATIGRMPAPSSTHELIGQSGGMRQ